MSKGIVLENCTNYEISNCKFNGNFTTAIEAINSTGGKLFKNDINIYKQGFNKKIGRNEKCPCGSGKKYKKCCLGGIKMSTGIKVSGHKNNIEENNIKLKGKGVAIDITGDENSVKKNHILIDEDLKGLIETLKLPEDTPLNLLEEAIDSLKDISTPFKEAPIVLEKSSLKKWLNDKGFNMAYWVGIAISLGTFAIGLG